MFTGWMFVGMFFGAVAIIIVWVLIVALVVAWYEDRHHKPVR